MPPSDSSIRNQIASNIDRLAEILTKNQVVRDPGPLYRAAAQCREYRKRGLWGYDVENLIFQQMGNLRRLPRLVEINDIFLKLSISVEGLCKSNPCDDPFTHLELNIWIESQYIGANNLIEHPVCAWHLDRHIRNDDESEQVEIPEFVHPSYHFHFGGHHLESIIGEKNLPILVLDSPRIAHPPMEAILGVDFVLTNFVGSPILGFRNEGEYSNLVKEMQMLIWRPYIGTLSNMWGPNQRNQIWDPSLVWPQLIH